MRRFELVFLVMASCTSDETSSSRPPTGSKQDDAATSSGGDSSTQAGDAASGSDAGGDANVKPLGPPRVYVGSGDGKIL